MRKRPRLRKRPTPGGRRDNRNQQTEETEQIAKMHPESAWD